MYPYPFSILALIMSRYRFIDRIIAAAVASSPHTTPSKTFPSTNEAWNKKVEDGIFGIPFRLRKPLDLPDEDADDDEDEEYEIVRYGSPKKNQVKVDD